MLFAIFLTYFYYHHGKASFILLLPYILIFRMRSWRPNNFALICWTTATIPAISGHAAAVGSVDQSHLLQRASQQCNGDSSLTYCGNGLPNHFCCPEKTTCKQLNNVWTPAAICCPNGSDCSKIATISCDTSKQGIPAALAHMLDLKVRLLTCGPQCCPLGYQCGSDGTNFSCNIQDVTKQAQSSTSSQPTSRSTAIVSLPTTFSISTTIPQSTSPTGTPASSSISTSTPQTTSPTGIPASSSTPAPGINTAQSTMQPIPLPQKFSGSTFSAGFFPGIVIGVLLCLGALYLLNRRRNRRRNRQNPSSDKGTSAIFAFSAPPPKGPQNISSPIYRPGMSDRTDFAHTRSASGTIISPPPPPPPMSTITRATQALRRTLSSGGTLVPQSQTQQQQGKTPTISLGPVFETPTRPQRTEQNPVRALFSTSPPARGGATRSMLSRSGASQETIDVLMRPAPPEFGMPLRREEDYEVSPATPMTTYSDVYRAAGVSPTKAEARARQLDVERGGGNRF